MAQVSHWPRSQPGTAAMPPSLVTEHLQPAGMIAAGYKYLPIAAPLRVPIDSPEAAPMSKQINGTQRTKTIREHLKRILGSSLITLFKEKKKTSILLTN